VNHLGNLVDSHAHLDMEEFDQDRAEVIRRAFREGVQSILCPIDISSKRSLDITLEMTARHKTIFAAAGLHPHQAKLRSPHLFSAIKTLTSEKKIFAIGEIGLDFHYGFSSPDEQKKALREQLALAQELELPVILHSRNAGRDIALAVREERFLGRGVLHCFTEDWDFARIMLDAGFSISFSGIVTFPRAYPLREIVKRTPLDRILIETDAPYLAPVPHRGKRNEPAYVAETAVIIAGIKNMPFFQFADAVSQNFSSLFAIPSRKEMSS
jgi:TatD DNase family protein